VCSNGRIGSLRQHSKYGGIGAVQQSSNINQEVDEKVHVKFRNISLVLENSNYFGKLKWIILT
jgi:hypothetical protein